MRFAMRPLQVAIFVAIMALWGRNFVAAKIGLQQLPALLMMALRRALVAVRPLPFVGRPRSAPTCSRTARAPRWRRRIGAPGPRSRTRRCSWSVSGVAFLDQPVTLALVAGAALTILGIGIIIVRRPKLVAPEAERV